MSRRHDSGGGPPSGGRYGGGRGAGGGGRHQQDSHGMSRDGGGGRMNRKNEFRNDREPRNRRGSGDDYHRFGSSQRGMNSRYSKPNNRKPNNVPDRPEVSFLKK